jgi:NADPH:quinone reductase-like Zn-dependent oxidoreductase
VIAPPSSISGTDRSARAGRPRSTTSAATFLAQLLKSTANNGNVAAVGLVAGSTLSTHGDAVPAARREPARHQFGRTRRARLRLAVWQRLATDLRLRQSDSIVTRTVTLDELPQAFDVYLEGRHRGRTLVRIAGSD